MSQKWENVRINVGLTKECCKTGGTIIGIKALLLSHNIMNLYLCLIARSEEMGQPQFYAKVVVVFGCGMR